MQAKILMRKMDPSFQKALLFNALLFNLRNILKYQPYQGQSRQPPKQLGTEAATCLRTIALSLVTASRSLGLLFLPPHPAWAGLRTGYLGFSLLP